MDFTCVIESTSEATSKLARMTLDILKAGYTIHSQKMDKSADGVITFKLSATSIGEKNAANLEKDLSGIAGYKLISLNDKAVNSASSPAASEQSDTDVSAILTVIQKNYPNFAPELKKYSKLLPDKARAATLIEIGQRVGAGIYNRDYSLGSPLAMPATLKRELLPALKKFSAVELIGSDVSLTKCPFCASSDDEAPSCQFISGFIQGFLNKNPAVDTVAIEESFCGSGVDGSCTFTLKQ